MQITITFSTNNAAFDGDPMPEIRAVLERARKALEHGGGHKRKLLDTNGNHIGDIRIED